MPRPTVAPQRLLLGGARRTLTASGMALAGRRQGRPRSTRVCRTPRRCAPASTTSPAVQPAVDLGPLNSSPLSMRLVEALRADEVVVLPVHFAGAGARVAARTLKCRSGTSLAQPPHRPSIYADGRGPDSTSTRPRDARVQGPEEMQRPCRPSAGVHRRISGELLQQRLCAAGQTRPRSRRVGAISSSVATFPCA